VKTHLNLSAREVVLRGADLPAAALTESEREFFADPAHVRGLPFAVTRHYLSLIDWSDPEDPIRRQCIPRREEGQVRDYELSDPLGEDRAVASPRLVHRYPDRALLLVTSHCATYCRHCFRRRFSGSEKRAISSAEAGVAAAYLRDRPEIRELILSGGDPLMLSDPKLFALLECFRSLKNRPAFRIHTRLPVVLPRRFTAPFLDKLAAFRPLRLVTQFNHPRELGADSRRAADGLLNRGISVLNQAVLLRGVNDSTGTQIDLIRALVDAGITPYYLFQGDLARGTAHLRVPLDKGLRLMEELKSWAARPDPGLPAEQLPAAKLPVYALDQPGLGGKIPLDSSTILDRKAQHFLLAGCDGKAFTYPVES
jgi:lysine 2,3-aminomutase